MQMVRLNVMKRNSPAGRKGMEKVDLDEKIRRIREANKAREQRFLEIEQDKKLALDAVKKELSEDVIQTEAKSKPTNTTMRGVQPANCKNTSKGRGRRLAEMSHQSLKAENFETRTVKEWEVIEQSLPEKIKLKSNSRSKIREMIKTNKEHGATAPKSEKLPTDISSPERTSNCKPENYQSDEITKDEILIEKNEENDNFTQDLEDPLPLKEVEKLEQDIDIKQDIDTKQDIETKPDNPCKKEDKKMENILESVDKQEAVKETGTMKHDDRPKITVKLKKTASSSSFDNSMAMLSPLDLPQNWGDCDFSDEDLPAISTWRN